MAAHDCARAACRTGRSLTASNALAAADGGILCARALDRYVTAKMVRMQRIEHGAAIAGQRTLVSSSGLSSFIDTYHLNQATPICGDGMNEFIGLMLAQLPANHELEAGPDTIDSATLDANEAKRQADLSNRVPGDVGRDFGGLLWPGYPRDSIRLDAPAKRCQVLLQLRPVNRRDLNQVC